MITVQCRSEVNSLTTPPLATPPNTKMKDEFSLQRFINAQNPVWEQVVQELRRGRKQTRWMWFVFPQVPGLGRSAIAEKYAIRSTAEAAAYLAHPVLNDRLRKCLALTLQLGPRSARNMFGYPDNLKFRSSLTLFRRIAEDNEIFTDALRKYFAGEEDLLTLEIMKGWQENMP